MYRPAGPVLTPEELGAPPPEFLAAGREPDSLIDRRLRVQYKRTIVTKTVLAGVVAVLLIGVGIAIYMTGDSGSSVEYPFDVVTRGGLDPKLDLPSRPTNPAGTTDISMNSTNSTYSNDTDGSERRVYLPDDYTDQEGGPAAWILHPPEQCHAAELVDCGSTNSSGWYLTGGNCYRWTRHTQCSNSVDSFMTESSCLDACSDGWCSVVKNSTDLRHCATADKTYQWFFADGRCQLLSDSEAGCLRGDNRFRTKQECTEICVGASTTRCSQDVSLSEAACEEGRISPYVFNRIARSCGLIAFCAATSFVTYEDCRETCLS